MEARKQAIMAALDKFVAQRPGLEFGNYGDVKAYRSEMRSITRDRHDYGTLARAVERSDSITADDLLSAAEAAFSGRLSIEWHPAGKCNGDCEHDADEPFYRIDYVTGQYFPTEYRKAACAVLASALWYHVRKNCMPTSEHKRRRDPRDGNAQVWCERRGWVSPWDWLRAYFRREFGRGIANRWFS